jgi:hypothetical protein
MLMFTVSSNPSEPLLVVTALLGAVVALSFWRYGF